MCVFLMELNNSMLLQKKVCIGLKKYLFVNR